MNSFTQKLWQHLNHRKHHRKSAYGGFTLIELLVVIIIIGILSAIALPSFLKQAAKAKEIEATNYIDYMNTEQNAYYMEKTDFKTSVTDFDFAPNGLEVNTNPNPILSLAGISHQTENYYYGVKIVSNVGDIDEAAAHIGFSENPVLKSYLGVVYLENGQMKTVLCKATMSELQGIYIQFMAGNIDELESEYCNQ